MKTKKKWDWTPNEVEDGIVIGVGRLIDENGADVFTEDYNDFLILSDKMKKRICTAVNAYEKRSK